MLSAMCISYIKQNMLVTDLPGPMEIYKSMYKYMQQGKQSHAIVLDLKVIDNPILVADDNYKALYNRIKLYNRKVLEQPSSKQKIDTYEVETHNSLYRILGEINAMANRQIQLESLRRTRDWLEEHDRVILSRMAQGVIRYRALRRRNMSLQNSPDKNQENRTERTNIPSEVLATTMLPYRKKWRSSHQDYGIPSERLGEFKRKILNIQPMMEQKTMPLLGQDRASRVLYPRPIKPVVEEQHKEEEKAQEENKPAEPGVPGEQPPAEGEPVEENQQPMLGEQPEQPEEPQQPEETGEDKLAPKNKIYSDPIRPPITTRIPNDIEAKGTFIYLQPDSERAERAMQLRFKNIQNQALTQVREDKEKLQVAQKWGRDRSRMTKQLQKRLEFIALQPSYKFTEDERPEPYRLTDDEERRFHLARQNSASVGKEVDLSLQLPKLTSNLQGYEKTVETSKLKNLKRRFSHILNLTTDVEQRQIPKSVCQYSSRFKSFSAVLQQHSTEKQRQIQMEEVRSIKEKLTKNKLGINVTTLAHGLCLPEYEEGVQKDFPISNLPSNPFMVQKKKKKKK